MHPEHNGYKGADKMSDFRGTGFRRQIQAIVIIVTLVSSFSSIGSESVFAREPLQEMNDRAIQLYEDGRYAEASELGERVLKEAEETFGPDDPKIAAFLNNLAVMYYAQGRYADAIARYERAISITEQTLGADHPRVKALQEGLNLCRKRLTEQTTPEEEAEIDEGEDTSDVAESAIKASPSREKTATSLTKYGEEIKASLSSPPQTSKKLFTVQVGAFSSLANAKAVQERLEKNGYEATITTAVSSGKTLHKVHVGAFDARNKARTLSEEIRTLTGLDTLVTPK